MTINTSSFIEVVYRSIILKEVHFLQYKGLFFSELFMSINQLINQYFLKHYKVIRAKSGVYDK